MAAVSLFWKTNLAAVTSCENTLCRKCAQNMQVLHKICRKYAAIAENVQKVCRYCNIAAGQNSLQTSEDYNLERFEKSKAPLTAALDLPGCTGFTRMHTQ